MTVLDDAGVVVDRWAFRHTEQDLVGALDRLARLAEPAALPVIIERASGLVVERLLAAGHPVVPVHPTAFWAARPRWARPGGIPSRDSYTGDYLLTAARLRPGPPDVGLQERQLWALSRGHLRALPRQQQLGALLEAHWPGPKAVFFRLASPIALAFLTDYPTPQAAARLGQARMASLLPTAQLPRRQDPGRAAGQAPVRADRASRHPGRHPGDPCPRPGPAAAHPAWDHRRARSGVTTRSLLSRAQLSRRCLCRHLNLPRCSPKSGRS